LATTSSCRCICVRVCSAVAAGGRDSPTHGPPRAHA
jgi:hypothetical protein